MQIERERGEKAENGGEEKKRKRVKQREREGFESEAERAGGVRE